MFSLRSNAWSGLRPDTPSAAPAVRSSLPLTPRARAKTAARPAFGRMGDA